MRNRDKVREKRAGERQRESDKVRERESKRESKRASVSESESEGGQVLPRLPVPSAKSVEERGQLDQGHTDNNIPHSHHSAPLHQKPPNFSPRRVCRTAVWALMGAAEAVFCSGN